MEFDAFGAKREIMIKAIFHEYILFSINYDYLLDGFVIQFDIELVILYIERIIISIAMKKIPTIKYKYLDDALIVDYTTSTNEIKNQF